MIQETDVVASSSSFYFFHVVEMALHYWEMVMDADVAMTAVHQSS